MDQESQQDPLINADGHFLWQSGYSSRDREASSYLPVNADKYASKLAFGVDIIYASLIDAQLRLIRPRILIEVDKGFFLAEGVWTCYRRNYFGARCHFEVKPNPQGTLSLLVDQRSLPVGQFLINLTAQTASTDNIPSTPIELVQHSRKGDNQPPTRVGFYELPPLGTETSSALSRGHTFERIQFRIPTANNGRRRVDQQQFFNLVIELWCELIGGDRVKIAQRVSAPIIVRGRHPGQFRVPVVAQQHQYAGPGLNLEGFPPENPALVEMLQANYLQNELSIGRDDLKKIIERERPLNDLPLPSESQSPGQHSTELASAEVKDFDTSSISSGSDVFSLRSAASSVTSSGGPADLNEFVVSTLLDDEGIKNLCVDGFSLLNPDKFERHLRRTLKTFAKNLVLESSGNLSKDLGYSLRRRVAALARNIREQVHTLDALENSVNQINQVKKEISFEQCDNGKENDSEVDLDDSDLDHDGDGDSEVEADRFTSVRDKISISNPFETLREDLLDFVVPFMLNGETSGQGVQDLQTRYSFTNFSDILAATSVPRSDCVTTSRIAWSLSSRRIELRRLERYMIKLRQLWTKIKWPRVECGYTKREFLCECGELLRGDFEKSSTNEYSALENYSSHSVGEQQHSAPSAAPSTTQQAVSGGIGLVTSIPNMFGPSGTSTATQQSNAVHGSMTYRSLPSSSARYLEVCINTDQYNIILEEIDISAANAIHTDGQLFREIRRRYDQARSKVFVHRFKLFKPSSVNFVQFCVSDQSVGILQSPRAIPTDSQDYDFSPCPMKDPPPVPESIFLHLLTSKRPHLRNTWLSRLPKKRNTRILPSQSTVHQGTSYATGWGVHIIESPNGDAIFRITVASVLMNFLLALTYIGATHGDVQGAFAISAFLVAGESAITFAYFHYHNAGQYNGKF